MSSLGRKPRLWQAVAAVALAAVVISSGILFFDAADAVPVLLVLAMVPAIVIALAIGVRGGRSRRGWWRG